MGDDAEHVSRECAKICLVSIDHLASMTDSKAEVLEGPNDGDGEKLVDCSFGLPLPAGT